jgi:hypothetical protein
MAAVVVTLTRARICPAVVAVLMSAAGTAQEKPDFVGTWVLTDPADASKDTARELVVKRGADTGPATTLVVERRFEREVQSASYEVGLVGGTVGGEVRGSPDAKEMKWTSYSVRRYGHTLAIVSGSYSGPTHWEVREFSEREEVWSLEEDGTLGITIFQRRTGSDPGRTRATYRKK